MTFIKKLSAAASVAALLVSTGAMAGTVTRSSTALPTAASQTDVAPTTQVRKSTKLKKKSNAYSSGAYAVGAGALLTIGGAIYIIADDSNGPDSPG